MKSKIYLDKKDFYRVLLTDVLPYEVPFILSNEGFYRNLKATHFIQLLKNIRINFIYFTSKH